MASRARGGAKPGEPTPEELAKANKKGEKDQKRIEKKLRQTELTDNIKMSYQTIRPTIIQAQRILKILDTLKIKFQISQLLNFEFVKHFESDETMEASKLEPSKIAKLSKPTLSCLAKIAGLQRKMHDLLSQEAVQESQVGEEEQDDSRRDEDLDDEDNQEARERRAKEEAEKERIRQERESQVMYLKEKMEGDFNNLVRQLERDQTELAVIRSLNPQGNKTEHFVDSFDSLESIKMIFLKKLSTGSDEDSNHQQMLKDLDTKIKNSTTMEETIRKELHKLVEDKKRYKEEEDKEIAALREHLNKIREDEIDSINKLKERERKEKEKEDIDHEDKYKRHKNNVDEERKKLDDAEKKTEDLQSKQLTNLTQTYNKYKNSMTDTYDADLSELKGKLNQSKQLHAEVEEELRIVEDEYRRIKHEKEINEAIELEWQIKLQKFEMHEERKEKAAEFIVNMWKAWKALKKKPKKTKPKPK